MARFKADMPDDLMKQLSKVSGGKMPQEMLKAGADVVLGNIKQNMPDAIRHSSGMMSCLYETKVYSTPSDNSINIKIGFDGYFFNSKGKKTPAPLVANVFEYGRSGKSFPKQPFMRKSFNRQQITEAMKNVQKKYISGGDDSEQS